jgi:Tfp pilus assembly protein PilV
MTIMAIGVTGILGAFSSALLGGSLAEDYAKASLLMQQITARVRSGAITPYDVTQGTFAGETRFQWTASFVETDVDYLYQVDLIVVWRRSGRQTELKLTTYQYCDPSAVPVLM